MRASNLPDGVRDEHIPGNSMRDAFVERFLDKHAHMLLQDFIYDPGNADLMESMAVGIESMSKEHLQRITEASAEFQVYCDRCANEAWVDLCEYKQDNRREE